MKRAKGKKALFKAKATQPCTTVQPPQFRVQYNAQGTSREARQFNKSKPEKLLVYKLFIACKHNL